MFGFITDKVYQPRINLCDSSQIIFTVHSPGCGTVLMAGRSALLAPSDNLLDTKTRTRKKSTFPNVTNRAPLIIELVSYL